MVSSLRVLVIGTTWWYLAGRISILLAGVGFEFGEGVGGLFFFSEDDRGVDEEEC